jgi:triosephosphate isomerase
MHAEASGAFTGEVSAAMLVELGVTYVILGHSERRTLMGETDAVVQKKVRAAIHAGLIPIVCVGETLDEREAGRMVEVVSTQVRGSLAGVTGDEMKAGKLVIAYEPVWAIGTGLTPTLGDVETAHAHIRTQIVARFGPAGHGVRILYGGSVTPANAGDLLRVADVGGVLVGGASLTAESLLGIASSAP